LRRLAANQAVQEAKTAVEDQTPSQKNWLSAALQTLQEPSKNIWYAVRIPLIAIILALLVGAVILALSGADPVVAYQALFRGAFGSARYIQRTLEKATPLIFAGLAVAFGFKAGIFNIGAQGQLLMGALTAGFVGFAVKGLPPAIHIPLALLSGAVAGAFFGAIPGALRAYSGAHEVITTIMLNYVAINITDYLSDGPLKDTSPGNIVARLPLIEPSAKIPLLGPVPVGFIIALVVAGLIAYVLERTTFGFEINSVGLNPHASTYAGMKTKLLIVSALVVSGLLAGVGGAVETQGVVGRFQPGFNTGLGFDGLTVALLGRNNPFGVILAALLLGAMRGGANLMQFDAKVSANIIDVIQGLMLLFVTADVLIRTVFRLRKDKTSEISLTTSWGGK
jgi:simple sugar transport system permease protein